MATQPLSPLGLKLQLEQKPNEIIVHCEGKITAENSAAFQREIRDLIPESQGQIAAKSYRIVLDLSNLSMSIALVWARCWVYGRQQKRKAATLKSQT